MATDLVHLRIDQKIRKEIKELMQYSLFSNETEFIRDSIRRNIELHKKIQLLDRMRNTLPKTKRKIKASSNIFRDFGLE